MKSQVSSRKDQASSLLTSNFKLRTSHFPRNASGRHYERDPILQNKANLRGQEMAVNALPEKGYVSCSQNRPRKNKANFQGSDAFLAGRASSHDNLRRAGTGTPNAKSRVWEPTLALQGTRGHGGTGKTECDFSLGVPGDKMDTW